MFFAVIELARRLGDRGTREAESRLGRYISQICICPDARPQKAVEESVGVRGTTLAAGDKHGWDDISLSNRPLIRTSHLPVGQRQRPR